MKSLLKLIFLIAVLTLAAPFALQDTGYPWFSRIQQYLGQLTALSTLNETEKRSTNRNSDTSAQSDVTPTIYRWQDKQGQWHYSDRPPPGQSVEEGTVEKGRVEKVTLAPLNQYSSGDKQAQTQRNSPHRELLQEVPLPDILSLSEPDALVKQLEDSQRLIQARQAELDALKKQLQ